MEQNKIQQNVLSSFRMPVKYSTGYIFDADNQMMMEARGWGHLQYGPNAEETQDEMGSMFAISFNNTYGAGISPEAVKEMYEALQGIIECEKWVQPATEFNQVPFKKMKAVKAALAKASIK